MIEGLSFFSPEDRFFIFFFNTNQLLFFLEELRVDGLSPFSLLST